MLVTLGIDPGKDGAVAILRDGELVHLLDVGDPELLDTMRLLSKGIEGRMITYLERVHAMPKQGGVSMFSFGASFGWWRGVLDALQFSYVEILPQKWQAGLLPKKSNKSDKPGLEVARKLFLNADLKLKKHHNRADALLLAYVAYQNHRNVEVVKQEKQTAMEVLGL